MVADHRVDVVFGGVDGGRRPAEQRGRSAGAVAAGQFDNPCLTLGIGHFHLTVGDFLSDRGATPGTTPQFLLLQMGVHKIDRRSQRRYASFVVYQIMVVTLELY